MIITNGTSGNEGAKSYDAQDKFLLDVSTQGTELYDKMYGWICEPDVGEEIDRFRNTLHAFIITLNNFSTNNKDANIPTQLQVIPQQMTKFTRLLDNYERHKTNATETLIKSRCETLTKLFKHTIHLL